MTDHADRSHRARGPSAVTAYLSPYWVEVVSYSQQTRIVRFRRIHETTLRRMGRLAFERKARFPQDINGGQP